MVLWITAGLGVLVRGLQYFGDRSLSLDQLAVARNLADKGWVELLGPLAYDQVAPAAFLWVEKAALMVLGPSELALRLLPLLAGLASILVFLQLVGKLLQPWSRVGAMLVFSVGWAFVIYSASLKQYSLDVLAVLILVVGSLRLVDSGFERRVALWLGAFGAVAMLFSFPAVPVAAALGLLLAVVGWRRRSPDDPVLPPWLLTLGSTWGVAAGLQVLLARRGVSPETRAYMHDFWHLGFVPWDGSPFKLLTWLPRQLASVVDLMLLPAPEGAIWEQVLLYGCLALAALGAWVVLRRGAVPGLIVMMPLLVAILLAAAGVLPLSERTAIYAGPTLLVLSFLGAERIGGARLALALGVICSLPFWLDPAPWPDQPIPEVLDEVISQMEPGDRVYAYYGAGQAFAWYAPRRGLDWVQGQCHRGDVRAALRELDEFRGGSVWLVFSHVRNRFDELPAMLDYLRTIGVETDVVPDPHGNEGGAAAFAHRFDLSDEARLASATAETFEDVGDFTGRPEELCTGPAADF